LVVYYIHDCFALLSSGVNTNTNGVSDIHITGNRFENISTGCFILGDNIHISNNSFANISHHGIAVGESNYTIQRSISSCVISGNTFRGMGKSLVSLGGYAHAATIGINVNSKSNTYDDDSQDNGVIVSNNSFKDSYSDVGVTLIEVRGGAKVIGNYACGLQTNTSSGSIFIKANFSSDVASYIGVNSSDVKVYVENNTLEKKLSGYNINFGLHVVSVDNAYLYCSNNTIDADNQGAQYTATSNGFLPFVSLRNDLFTPTCYLNGLTDAVNLVTYSGGLPITGTNSTVYSTSRLPDVLRALPSRDITGDTTPSVAVGTQFWTNNTSPLSITNFDSSPDGAEITIQFKDANTTVVHAATKIILNGSANFVSTAGAILSLYKPSIIDAAWYEKGRSIP